MTNILTAMGQAYADSVPMLVISSVNQTEQLAEEMGLYRTPLERFGALETEAWRAARLVVDTGIHVFGWTRQQSIDLLMARAGERMPRAIMEFPTG